MAVKPTKDADSPLVLITGASGFTGHHMVVEAVRHGYRVRATDRSSRHYGPLFDALGAEFRTHDITRAEGWDSLLDGVDAVIHVAGIHDYSTPDAVMQAVNVEGVRNLCAGAVQGGVERVVHISSVGVYGYDFRDGEPVGEDAPKLTPPLNNYNRTKWEGEQVLWDFHENQGLRATALRPAAIYGARAEYGLYYVLKQIHADRRKKKNLMAGPGDRTEAFLHVRDMCRAAFFALETDATIGEAYNVADDTRITTLEFFRFVTRELLGVDKPFRHVPLGLLVPVAMAAQLFARITRTKSILERATLHYLSCDRIWDNAKLKAAGFELAYPTMEPGMRETIRWYVEHGWLPI